MELDKFLTLSKIERLNYITQLTQNMKCLLIDNDIEQYNVVKTEYDLLSAHVDD